jgi:hypothetical protein
MAKGLIPCHMVFGESIHDMSVRYSRASTFDGGSMVAQVGSCMRDDRISIDPPSLFSSTLIHTPYAGALLAEVALLQHAPREDHLLLDEGTKDMLLFYPAPGRVPLQSLAMNT